MNAVDTENRRRLLELVKTLTQKVTAEGKAKRASGAEASQYLAKTLQKADQFVYSESGLTSIGFTSSTAHEPMWDNVTGPLVEQAKEYDEWKELLVTMKHEFHLSNYLRSILFSILNNREHTEDDLQKMQETLIDDPVQYRPERGKITLRFAGLVVLTDPFKLKLGKWTLTVRAVKASDFDHEEFVGGYQHHYRNDWTEAIGHIEGAFSDQEEMMWFAHWCVALMRLAVPSGVELVAVESRSCGFAGMSMSSQTSGGKHPVAKKVILKDENLASFIAFCEMVAGSLKLSQVREEQTRVDHIAIAYNRYARALAAGGLIEERIASAVMGIECLFMIDKDVIGFKLSIRLPKLLGLIGYAPVQVKELIADAYTIRSKYVHGDSLSPKDTTKLVKEYGSLEEMLTGCVAYLRAAFVLCICSLPDKPERVKLIDSTLVDNAQQDVLDKKISAVKSLVAVHQA